MGDLVRWLLGRCGAIAVAPAAAKQMKTLERMPLSAQHALHLVRVGEKRILVVTGPGCCEVRDIE
jgi:hypothetical protein